MEAFVPIPMEKVQLKLAYNEEIAQSMLSRKAYDELVVYCLPCTKMYLAEHKWRFVDYDSYDDAVQILSISLMRAVRNYDEHKDVKLFTWINNNFKYAMLTHGKKENPYRDRHPQLEDDHDICYEPEECL
jgi:DNA-directed RNA polymerase specialized sigma subunit